MFRFLPSLRQGSRRLCASPCSRTPSLGTRCFGQQLSAAEVMKEPNIGARLNKAEDLTVVELEKPNMPVGNEVLIQVEATGICGSDVEYLKHGRIADFVLQPGKTMVIGHESGGTVLAVGDQVQSLTPGDKVAMEPGIPCQETSCDFCSSGSYNLCPEVRFFATPPVDGSLQRYVLHPERYTFKIPTSMSYEEAALCEPLSVGIYACERANLKPGQSVAIFGAGPIGLVSLLVAKAQGARFVSVTDVDDHRLSVARSFGADLVVNVGGKDPKQVRQEIEGTNGGQVDCAIECCGINSATVTAIQSTKSNGIVVGVGMKDFLMNIDMTDLLLRQVDLRGVFRYRNTYPAAIDLISSGKLNVAQLVSHRFGAYEQASVDEAFDIAATQRGNPTKVMFNHQN